MQLYIFAVVSPQHVAPRNLGKVWHVLHLRWQNEERTHLIPGLRTIDQRLPFIKEHVFLPLLGLQGIYHYWRYYFVQGSYPNGRRVSLLPAGVATEAMGRTKFFDADILRAPWEGEVKGPSSPDTPPPPPGLILEYATWLFAGDGQTKQARWPFFLGAP